MSARSWVILLPLITSFHCLSVAPKINVKIGKKLDSITVAGLDIVKNLPTKSITKNYNGRKSVKFNCVGESKTSNKQLLLASLSSPAGVIKWEDIHYRGTLKIVNSSKQNGCDLINEIDLEDYISSLLAKEMNASWPIEALKAQAIAARTYALHQIKSNKNELYDLENSEKHQVNGTLLDETPSTTKASEDTKGEVLQAKSTKEITPIFFHAKCGGRTLTPEKVWANKVAGYQEVDCPFCHKYGVKPWAKEIKRNEFKTLLQKLIQKFSIAKAEARTDKEVDVMMAPDSTYDRYLTVYKDGDLNRIKKSDLRKVLGREIIPSNNFEVKVQNKKIIFKGDGYGHGVGLCQLGALELAKRGYNYRQILSYYFPGHEIKKIY